MYFPVQNVITHPAFLVEEGLSAVDGAESSLPEFAVDHDAVARDFPFVESEDARGCQETQSPHPLLGLLHPGLVSKKDNVGMKLLF